MLRLIEDIEQLGLRKYTADRDHKAQMPDRILQVIVVEIPKQLHSGPQWIRE